MTTRIPYTRPSITEREVSYATDAAANGWGARCYDFIHRFEATFAQHLGSRFALATSSCTGALHMGMAALDIGPGDEVIAPDITWIASVAPIVHLGATPILVDIRPDTWCIDPAAVERAITPRTKAILAVHLYGNLCAMDELLVLGRRHGVPIIEDAAEAIGSIYRGRRAGSLGAFGAFSFHGTKTLTTGEGGMFVTSDEALYERVLTLSNHGRARGEKRQFWPTEIGFKYKMSNIEAGIGLGQVERVEELVGRKQAILEYYRQGIADLPEVSINLPPNEPDTVLGAWMPTVVFTEESGVELGALIESFERANIDARVFFHPLSSLSMFAPRPENVHAYSLARRAFNLPSFHDMTDQDQERVIAVLRQLVRRIRSEG